MSTSQPSLLSRIAIRRNLPAGHLGAPILARLAQPLAEIGAHP